MSYLLDTCVLSEFTRPEPSSRVIEWLANQRESDLFLSVIAIGEIAQGISRLPAGAKQRQLHAWLHTDLRNRFSQRILPVSEEVALQWGELSGRMRSAGVTVGMADGLIGATALVHSLVVVTRNTDDLSRTGAPVFDPWVD